MAICSRVKNGIRRYFYFDARQTSFTQEIRGGCVSFLTMSYVLLVNPKVLSHWIGGDNPPDDLKDAKTSFINSLSASTAIVCATGTILLGLLTRLPFACGPAMGMNGLLAGVVVLAQESQEQYDISRKLWNGMMMSTMIAGLTTLMLSVLRISPFLLRHMPDVLKNSIRVGIGLFQAFLALRSIHVIMQDDRNLLKLVDKIDFSDRSGVGTTAQLLFLFTLLNTSALYVCHVDAAILISISLTTLICWISRTGGVEVPRVPVQIPEFAETFWNANYDDYTASAKIVSSTISFVVITLFDVGGGMFAITALMRGMMTEEQEALTLASLKALAVQEEAHRSTSHARGAASVGDGRSAIASKASGRSSAQPPLTQQHQQQQQQAGDGIDGLINVGSHGSSSASSDGLGPILPPSVMAAHDAAIHDVTSGDDENDDDEDHHSSSGDEHRGSRSTLQPKPAGTQSANVSTTENMLMAPPPRRSRTTARLQRGRHSPRTRSATPPASIVPHHMRTPKSQLLADRLLLGNPRGRARDNHVRGGFAALVADYNRQNNPVLDADSYASVPHRRHISARRGLSGRPAGHRTDSAARKASALLASRTTPHRARAREVEENQRLLSGDDSNVCTEDDIGADGQVAHGGINISGHASGESENHSISGSSTRSGNAPPLHSRIGSFFLGFGDGEGELEQRLYKQQFRTPGIGGEGSEIGDLVNILAVGEDGEVPRSSDADTSIALTGDELLTAARARNTFIVIGFSTMLGGVLGNAPTTLYLECMAGVASGSRTGFASVVTGLLFLVALPFGPVFRNVPACAATPALLLIGSFMMSSFSAIPWNKHRYAIPAFLTIIMMPFTASITPGIAAGLLSYYFLAFMTIVFHASRRQIRRWRRQQVNPQYEVPYWG